MSFFDHLARLGATVAVVLVILLVIGGVVALIGDTTFIPQHCSGYGDC